MSAPVILDPSSLRPGFAFRVDFLRGSTSPGSSTLRAAIVSPPASTPGNIVVGTERRAVFSKEDVEVAIGRGLGYYAYQALYANDPNCQVDLIACAESGGAAATGTFTFGGAPTSNQTHRVWIMGVQIDLSWNVGEANTVARDNAVLKINQYGLDLFVIASAGAGGVVNITARGKGPCGNDVTIRTAVVAGAGGTCTASGATLTGGTTEVDMTTALANLATQEYDYILICASNTDAQSASGSANPARLATHIDNNLPGFTGKLQQGIYGSTGTYALAKTNAIARNHTNLEHICSRSDESLPCEIAAAELGDRMRRRRIEINANRVLQPLKRVRGAANVQTAQPTDTEANDALANGVSLIDYSANGTPRLCRSITTHSQDTNGNPDRRCVDTNETDSFYDYMKGMRTALPQTYQSPDGQVKISKNRQPGDDPNPEGVVEERDIRATIITLTQNFWIPKGVIDGTAFAQAANDGTLQVNVNATDATQVDIFVPAKVFKILAKMGFLLAKVG
jgi:phage tail sheath gpL-like